MATAQNQSIHSGSTILLKIAGNVIGRAQGVSGRRSFGTEGVYEIGSIMPQEHVNNRYEGTATLDRFFVKKKSLKDLGLGSLGEEVLKQDVIDIEILDKFTQEIIRVYRGCTIADYSEQFRVGAIAGENASFMYLECSDNTDTNNG